MNLTNMLRKDAAIEDHALVDHSWMQDSGLARVDDPILNIDSMKNPNNIKPQVELEWGLGGPDINLDEPAGEVKRNIPEENLGDASAVILFARDRMNRGFRGSQVVAALKAKYPSVLLAKASTGLRNLFAMEGIVGRVMIDARGYKNCQAAVKASSNSPYKRFIKYVYGCSCGDPHIMQMNDSRIIGSDTASCGNGFDDFLAGDKTTAKTAAHCRSTMLPIMAAQGDLDKSLMDSTLIEMMNLTSVPQTVLKKVWAMKGSNLGKIRAAFRYLDKKADQAEISKYAGNVDSKEFQLRQADNEVQIENGPMDDMYVDGTNPSLFTDFEPNQPVMTNFDGPASLPGLFDSLELTNHTEQEQIPIELMDERGGATQVQIDRPAPLVRKQIIDQPEYNMDVDFFAPENMDVNLDGEQEIQVNDTLNSMPQLDVNPEMNGMDIVSPENNSLDVEMTQFSEPEFEGTDEITFDEKEEPAGLIDVNWMSSGNDTDIELTDTNS